MTYDQAIAVLRKPANKLGLQIPSIQGIEQEYWTAIRVICLTAVEEHEQMHGEQEMFYELWNEISEHRWHIGELAADWMKGFARGRTIRDFAVLAGIDAHVAQICLETWTEFSGYRAAFPGLRFSHFQAAVPWADDGGETGAIGCLAWASETKSTVAEMRAWRRAQRGEDLTIDEAAP